MEAIVGILIIVSIIYTLNKFVTGTKQLQKKLLPDVEIEEVITNQDHKLVQESDRLEVSPDMIVNQGKSKKQNTGHKQRYSITYFKQGMIMKEILDTPRAKKPLHKRRIYS